MAKKAITRFRTFRGANQWVIRRHGLGFKQYFGDGYSAKVQGRRRIWGWDVAIRIFYPDGEIRTWKKEGGLFWMKIRTAGGQQLPWEEICR